MPRRVVVIIAGPAAGAVPQPGAVGPGCHRGCGLEDFHDPVQGGAQRVGCLSGQAGSDPMTDESQAMRDFRPSA